MAIQYQVMRRTVNSYDILKVSPLKGPPGTQANSYEILGRIVFDKDEWFVEKPLWNNTSHEFHRINRPYIVFQAAFNALVSPKAPD